MKNKFVVFSGITVFFILLVLVRFYERVLFYDPLIDFYQGNFTIASPPSIDKIKLICYVVLRYFINAVLSIGIIALLFKNKKIIYFTSLVYVIFLILLTPIFSYFIYNFNADNYLMVFYIRRFLIQPILLLLLLAGLLYQYKINKKS
ncbi:exosortase F-associated protein [Mesonia hippocampi]|uniref:Exosortase F-associated protein n=1 Tax=Mesonia hippocampi TaxID=1628250 RepID=A0A840ESC9_9FLAO|nr:exosortase F system-associated protein [Mesonia hippocampi]MBB4119955.1 exosortase F-associated protein [Mesonia hippocampi]